MNLPLPDTTAIPADKPARSGWADAALAVLLGAASAALGLAPWLISGARLPLQNIWASRVLPEAMPIAFLPLSQYHTTTMVALLTVGSAVAGLAVRAWNPSRRGLAMGCAAAGALLIQGIAAVQAFSALGSGLARGPLASLYFTGLLAGTLAAMAAGGAALLMLAARSTAVAALGAGLMAVPAASWLAAAAAFIAGPGGVPVPLTFAWRWLPAVLVGLALAWCSVRPTVRVVVWVANLLLLWLVPALFTSVNYVLGTRVHLGDFAEMGLLARQILTATLGPDGGGGQTVAVALAIGLLGTGARELRRRQAASTA